MAPEIQVMLAAMIPFVDLKLAIPLGLQYGLSTTTTFLFAVIGAIIPPSIALAVIGPVSIWLRKRSKYIDALFERLFDKTRKEHTKRFNRYGAIFLIAFVALPIPGSGSIAGALIAFLFGINYWKALGLISIGVTIAGVFLTAGVGSIFAILDLFA